jgi:predicted peptidase
MANNYWSLLTSGLSVAAKSLAGRGRKSNLQTRTAQHGSQSETYQLYVPASLAGRRDVPVIIVLHGITQRGTGGYVPATGSAAALMSHYLEQVPAVILLPQCPPGRYWSDAEAERVVVRALEEVVAEFDADAARLYLTGVSMGGYGVWHMAAQHPGRFAALVSICGGSPLRAGERFAPIARAVGDTPAWVFHGADDKVVHVSESRRMVEAIREARGKVRYSEYEGVGHNVWLKVIAERELMPWLLSQRLA